MHRLILRLGDHPCGDARSPLSVGFNVWPSLSARPGPQSIEPGLNRYRGEMFCWPEGEYAEVFSRLEVRHK